MPHDVWYTNLAIYHAVYRIARLHFIIFGSKWNVFLWQHNLCSSRSNIYFKNSWYILHSKCNLPLWGFWTWHSWPESLKASHALSWFNSTFTNSFWTETRVLSFLIYSWDIQISPFDVNRCSSHQSMNGWYIYTLN